MSKKTLEEEDTIKILEVGSYVGQGAGDRCH